MIITKKYLDSVGRKSPEARMAMRQAGDKIRIRALKNALVSIGVCEITPDEAAELGLPVLEKTYPFTPTPLIYVVLDKNTFDKFPRITGPVKLEAARMRNGLVGILGNK